MGRPPKKQTKDAERPAVEPSSQSTAQPAPEPTPATPTPLPVEPAETASTITLRLDDTGRILPLREETRERLRQALEVSDLGEGYQPRPVGKFVDEALAGRLLDAIAIAQGFVFSKTAKLPYEKAAEVMRFDSEEKKSLAPPASALLNQYAGAWLARHGVLVEFSIKFGAIEAGKIDKAIALAREHQKKDGQ